MGRSLPVFVTAFGEYEAQEVVGEGGAGRVYRATYATGDYAIKLLHAAKVSREQSKRFKNEILFGSRTQHENIVRIIDHGVYSVSDTAVPFYVMPYYRSTLRKILPTLTPGTALKYYAQLLDGVEAAHLLKVWHRDIKPENVLFDSPNDRVLVSDFGIARFTADELATAVHTKPGTRLANFLYAAPEQRTSGRDVDQRADIFALGLILNELFTGEVPHGSSYTLISKRTPDYAYLDSLVEQMIAQNPADRPQTIEEVKRILISAKNQFVAFQKVDSLRGTVITASEITDPVVRDPIRVLSGNWDDEHLIFELSQAPPRQWQEIVLHGGGTYFMNYPPTSIVFRGNHAFWAASENTAQQQIDQFKERVGRANDQYARQVEEEARRRDAAERRQLEEAREAEERRLETLSKLRF